MVFQSEPLQVMKGAKWSLTNVLKCLMRTFVFSYLKHFEPFQFFFQFYLQTCGPALWSAP